MYEVVLFTDTEETSTPKWWLRFYSYQCDRLEVGKLNRYELNAILYSDNIHFHMDSDYYPYGKRSLIFENEAAFTMFLLKWTDKHDR